MSRPQVLLRGCVTFNPSRLPEVSLLGNHNLYTIAGGPTAISPLVWTPSPGITPQPFWKATAPHKHGHAKGVEFSHISQSTLESFSICSILLALKMRRNAIRVGACQSTYVPD